MNEETPLTEEQARQRRQEALRALAAQQQQQQQTAAGTGGTPATPGAVAQSSPAPSLPATAGQPTSQPAAPRADSSAADVVLGRRAPTRRRVWIAIAAAVLIIGVVGVSARFWLRLPTGHTTRPVPSALAIALDAETQCPQQAIWSPNSATVAVLGYQQCGALGGRFVSGSGNQPTTGGVVVLLDAISGRVTKTLQLDPTTLALVPAQTRNDPVAMSGVGTNYYALAWSPDGKQLAVGFSVYHVFDTAAPGDNRLYGAGLELVAADGSVARALALPSTTPQYGASVSSFQPLPELLWDLRRGAATKVQVAQGLSYRWGTDGSLTPVVALPATPDAPPPAAPGGPVGNPIGDAQFSVWQMGYANYGNYCVVSGNPTDGPTSCCPITSFYQVGFIVPVAWSPDGRYLLQGAGSAVGAYGKIAASLAPSPRPLPPGCGDPASAATVGATLAQMPVRDKALMTTLESLSPQPAQTFGVLPPPEGGATSAVFTWSPDGKRLAVQPSGANPQTPDTPVLLIYDCASGKLDASFTANAVLKKAQVPLNVLYDTNSVDIASFSWSADSQRLMLLGGSQPFVLILGPTALGI